MRWLDWFLVGGFLISAFLLPLSHEDPWVREAVWELLRIKPQTEHAGFWLKLTYDLSLGTALSIIFYALLVRIPEIWKRRRVRFSLATQYRLFKEASIAVFLGAANGSYNGDEVQRLLVQSSFRDYFKEVMDGDRQDRWNAAISNLNEASLQELTVILDVFREEVAYALNNTDARSDEAFQYLKRLSYALHANRSGVSLDYDSIKPFARFYWAVLSGWDWVSGYPKVDVIEKMIRAV